MPKDNPWKTVNSKYTHQNKWFKVRTDTVINPGGQDGEYNVVEITPAVSIVALNQDQEICLIREYRYPHQEWLWETPIGGIDAADADPLTTAQRELREETGYTSDEWEYVGLARNIKGATNHIAHTFIAKNIQRGERHTESDEAFEGERFVSFAEFFEEVRAGTITDGETIVSVAQAAAYLHLI